MHPGAPGSAAGLVPPRSRAVIPALSRLVLTSDSSHTSCERPLRLFSPSFPHQGGAGKRVGMIISHLKLMESI